MSKILAIDYGDKRVGLATADCEARIALPFGILENKGIKGLLLKISEICQKENVSQIVVGLPMGLANMPTEQTEKVEKFIKILKEKINLPVERQSELFTSRQARGIFKDVGVKKRHIDESAATLILADYLETSGSRDVQ